MVKMSTATVLDDEFTGLLDDLGDCVSRLNGSDTGNHDCSDSSSDRSGINYKISEELTDFLNKPSQHIERRSGARKLGASGSALARELYDVPLDERVKALADHCFPGATYKLELNEGSLTKLGDIGNAVSIGIQYSGDDNSNGRVEFNFGFNFKKNLAGTAVFIQELARYIGADPGLNHGDIVGLAFWKTPYLLEKTEGMYKVAFEFEKGRTSISFKQNGACGAPTQREYLDQSAYNFTLAKSNEEGTHVVFERYAGCRKVFVDSDLPDKVLGPDGVQDDVYATPGCLEHYVELSDNYMVE
ncbi:MAG: hypothetical protein V1729_06370 [Candidatus Woesearchaeota archaeon]